MTTVVVKTLNLHDTAVPEFGADVHILTEAALGRVLSATPTGYTLHHDQNRTVLIVTRDRYFTPKAKDGRSARWFRAHGGTANVTPARGTLVVRGRDKDGNKVALLAEHRINQAYSPFKRGESKLRVKLWHRHARLTRLLIATLRFAGYRVIAGGDLNVKPFTIMTGYDGQLLETGNRLDRIAISRPATINAATYTRVPNTDHPELTATITY